MMGHVTLRELDPLIITRQSEQWTLLQFDIKDLISDIIACIPLTIAIML